MSYSFLTHHFFSIHHFFFWIHFSCLPMSCSFLTHHFFFFRSRFSRIRRKYVSNVSETDREDVSSPLCMSCIRRSVCVYSIITKSMKISTLSLSLSLSSLSDIHTMCEDCGRTALKPSQQIFFAICVCVVLSLFFSHTSPSRSYFT